MQNTCDASGRLAGCDDRLVSPGKTRISAGSRRCFFRGWDTFSIKDKIEEAIDAKRVLDRSMESAGK